MATQIFVNLPVKDLDKSMSFFEALGYHFNPQFTNDQAACMVISDTIYAMLVTHPFFATFTDKAIADATQTTEVLVCLSAESKDAVNSMVEKAVNAGGKTTRQPTDYGWMYGWGFNDLDGHIWEVAWMDIANMPKP
ncbi:VOC family protein [Mucilaginibacter ginkgonis]|uniref:VOC family protein n=1 Tax=Mucilaginibacter ginkgonis TaxID=2682091 RepID=A0A6I4HZ23_9SPHI|nr:VOC family protein [Mucilaginibacter ginkgonis]QQL49338.1 VOC family protein [Mucilaginibacter ginkgonis]